MNVVGSSQLFGEESSYLKYSKQLFQYQKEIGSLECILYFDSTEMLEYQKDMFLDTLSEIIDQLQQSDLDIEKAKKICEIGLHEINTKLAAFGEKLEGKGNFPIRGVFQLYRGSEYVAALMGEVSVVILRNDQVHYRICQSATDPKPTVDRFNELLEGELKPEDQIICVGISLETYLDKADMQTVIEHAASEDIEVNDALLALLNTRVQQGKIAFMGAWHVEVIPLFAEYRFGRHVLKFWERFGGKVLYTKQLRTITMYILIGIVALVMLTWIVESFVNNVQQRYITDEGGVVMNISIEDIQKDIATFKRIDASSEQKIKKYNEIIAQLELLEKNNKRTVDVVKLRRILEKDYLEGFNIESVLDLEESTTSVYTLTQQERNALGELLQVFWKNGLFIVGREGTLLGALDDQVRGTLVSAGLERKINTCTLNLLKNGLYCFMSDGGLFNVLKSGLQPVTTQDSAFDTNVKVLDTFGSSYLYTLSTTPTSGNAHLSITRYPNQRGSQDAFQAGIKYEMQPNEEFINASSGMTSLAIDGTFLLRSQINQSLRQLRRPSAAPTLLVRKVPLVGGDTMRAPGGSVKTFSFTDARFIYMRDEEQQIFTVYRSTPYKTNDAHTTNYSLPYFFSVKFTLGDQKILDVFVEEGEKAFLYLMTADEVRRLSITELRDKFFAKEGDETE